MKHDRIQNLVMPSLAFNVPESMYVRTSTNVRILLGKGRLQFKIGGHTSFDTFFNGFTVHTWKKHCLLNDLHLRLLGQGKFLLRFGLHRMADPHTWLDEKIIRLSKGKELEVKMPFWDSLGSGILYFTLEAMGDAELMAGCFATNTLPEREVKLGIVVTHYNRKKYILPAISRIRKELLGDPMYKKRVEMIVVDNSRNISPKEAEGVRVIPNKNLGASGGFARGLLHLTDDGSFTDCLYMDDDGACEIESIRRSYALLSFAKTPKLAVSGAFLRELEPYRLYEKAAIFKKRHVLLKQGLDMRNPYHLIRAEIQEENPNYGAWCFFAFSISNVIKYPFPFFLRGDDILFSLMNRLNIVTLNGIACWILDFSFKESPLTRHFNIRFETIFSFLLPKYKWVYIKKVYLRFLIQLFSYNYASAKAGRLAIKNILKGPYHWLADLDTSKIRAQIKGFANSEELQPREFNECGERYEEPLPKQENILRFLLRLLTLNGFLLPNFMLKNAIIFQHKSFCGISKEIFRYKRVLYRHMPTGTGYIAEHNKFRFFWEFFLFGWHFFKLVVFFPFYKKRYQEAASEWTSESFWRQVYSKK